MNKSYTLKYGDNKEHTKIIKAHTMGTAAIKATKFIVGDKYDNGIYSHIISLTNPLNKTYEYYCYRVKLDNPILVDIDKSKKYLCKYLQSISPIWIINRNFDISPIKNQDHTTIKDKLCAKQTEIPATIYDTAYLSINNNTKN